MSDLFAQWKKAFVVKKFSTQINIALLLLRIVFGAAFVIHGFEKIQHPFSWMGDIMSVPGFFQSLAAIAEFFGGIAMILGIVTPVASLGIGFTMAVALCYHLIIKGDPFVSLKGGSYELAAIYFCIAVLFYEVGPGRFSLDGKIFGSKKQ
jgi:putative oxidoreductase